MDALHRQSMRFWIDAGLILRFEIKGDGELGDDFNFYTLKNALGGKDAGIGYVDMKKVFVRCIYSSKAIVFA